MSNLDPAPAETACGGSRPDAMTPVHELLVGRDVPITKTSLVNRTLPHRERRMIGAWCFVDHFGPDAVITMPGMRVPPHPHTGLQTVTWLIDGAVEHRDSLGSVQTIRPGQLNLMTAGDGISHSEESPADRPPTLHGVQLWVALPEAARGGSPCFEHLDALPQVALDGGVVTVLLGELAGASSPALVHTPIVGAEVVLEVSARVTLPLEPAYEHGVLVVAGEVVVDGEPLRPGALLYLGGGRASLDLTAPAGGRLLLVGGEPFEEEIVMWWNFVGRTHEDVAAARAAWMSAARFGRLDEGAADVSSAFADARHPDHGGAEVSTRSGDATRPAPERADRFGVVHGFDGAPLPAPALPNATLRARGRHSPRPPRPTGD